MRNALATLIAFVAVALGNWTEPGRPVPTTTGLNPANPSVLPIPQDVDNWGEFVPPPPPPSSMTGLEPGNNSAVPVEHNSNLDPEPPSLFQPPNGDTAVPMTPLLAVEPYPGGFVMYHFCVWQGGNKVADKYTLLPFWFIYEGSTFFTAGNYYQWSCRVRTTGGWSEWAKPEWMFAIAYPTTAPVPLSPLNGVRIPTTTPLLCVVPSAMGGRYHWRIEEVGQPVVIEKETRLPFWRVPSGAGYLRSGHTYNWSCRADITGGWSNWFSPYWSFAISDPGDGTQLQGAMSSPAFTCVSRPSLFSDQTRITYNLPRASDVTVTFYSIGGREVSRAVLGLQSAGSHDFIWNGRGRETEPLPAGVYLYRLQAGNDVRSERITKTN
jgi:hypothetical protein